jgi:tRNA-specific 2-thiouridylase
MMMRLWSESGRELDNRCCSPDAMAQARRVAAILGIPFYAVDAQQTFYERVVTDFLDGYAQGITPNPCLACNRWVRWEFLLNRALALGAQYLATGHYARLHQDETGKIQLLQALDVDKDQSYVLHVLTQVQLSQALFPLGETTKPQVRELARRFALPVAERPESQDLCFLGDGNYRDFLLRNAPHVEAPGPILDQDGRVLGQHRGLAFYTIGQRKGIGLATPTPRYVLTKDLERNALIVGPQEALGGQELLAGKVNWISGEAPVEAFRAQVKIRYKAQAAWGVVIPLDGQRVQVHFDERLRDITPGQAAVFYHDQICLGGGIIL